MEIEISKIVLDEYIYPRSNKSNKTIETYAEAIKAGAQFPPITVQRVINFNQLDEAILIIDGLHRLEAHLSVGSKTIEAVEYDTQPLDYETNKTALLLESAECNTKHGDRLSDGDKKFKARQIAEIDKDITEQAIANKFGVAQPTINSWISDIRARQKATRDSKIYRLSLLGWTQDEIAEAMGMTQPRVLQIINNIRYDNIYNLVETHDTEYAADYYKIDLALAWAIRMRGQEDRKRFKVHDEDGEKAGSPLDPLRTYDVWNWSDCDKRFGDDWPGRIPAQLVAHVLYYFTRKGDVVLDPMAGGGVVPDTCLLFERKCQAFDINVREARPEIKKHYWDIDNMTWPAMKKAPDLIFFDPPYYKKMDDDYILKAGDSVPLSSLPKDRYLEFYKMFFELAFEKY